MCIGIIQAVLDNLREEVWNFGKVTRSSACSEEKDSAVVAG